MIALEGAARRQALGGLTSTEAREEAARGCVLRRPPRPRPGWRRRWSRHRRPSPCWLSTKSTAMRSAQVPVQFDVHVAPAVVGAVHVASRSRDAPASGIDEVDRPWAGAGGDVGEPASSGSTVGTAAAVVPKGISRLRTHPTHAARRQRVRRILPLSRCVPEPRGPPFQKTNPKTARHHCSGRPRERLGAARGQEGLGLGGDADGADAGQLPLRLEVLEQDVDADGPAL